MEIKKDKKLAIVVPCYNEEKVLPETIKRLCALLDDLVEERLVARDSFILLVNDGSKDATWALTVRAHQTDSRVGGVNLAANVGHQNALMAGLSVAVKTSDAVVTIDADLQDDVVAIREMMQLWHCGKDVIYGVRRSRTTDTWFKRTTAQMFYRLMSALGVKTVYNHADYRLMSRRAVEHLLCFKERNLFLRGMVPLVGYSSAKVYYDRAERFAGESKYPLKKMIEFAIDGITSFSVKPVRLVFIMGVVFLLISLLIFCYVLYSYWLGKNVAGWSSLMLSVWFCSGCLLVGLGVMGEYIGKIYIEVKGRPRYNIEEVLL